MPSNHLILCCPLLLLPSIFPSIRVFSSESVLHIRWPKYWIFSFSISSSNEYPRLISFWIDWSWQIDGDKVETVTDFIFLGSKITVDGDYSHKIKRRLLLGIKAMTNLSSVQFSHSVVSHSLQPHESQHARPPCPSPTPGVHPNSCPLSQ